MGDFNASVGVAVERSVRAFDLSTLIMAAGTACLNVLKYCSSGSDRFGLQWEKSVAVVATLLPPSLVLSRWSGTHCLIGDDRVPPSS